MISRYIRQYTAGILLGILLSGCGLSPAEITNPVTWYAINGWSDTVEFDLYDEVCERYLPDQRLRAGRVVAVTSCGNEAGQAAVRYRREGLTATGSAWSSRSGIMPGERVYMQ